MRLRLRVDAQRLADALDDALDVEEIDVAACRRSSDRRRRARSRRTRATRRSPRARENRAPISNSRTSRCSRRRLCATASTRPGSTDGRSTAKFSDSGLAIGTRSPSAANGAAAASAMKPNVTASENPAPVMTVAQLRAPA